MNVYPCVCAFLSSNVARVVNVVLDGYACRNQHARSERVLHYCGCCCPPSVQQGGVCERYREHACMRVCVGGGGVCSLSGIKHLGSISQSVLSLIFTDKLMKSLHLIG